VATNCAALPTANAGQCATSNLKLLMLLVSCCNKWYINVWTFNFCAYRMNCLLLRLLFLLLLLSSLLLLLYNFFCCPVMSQSNQSHPGSLSFWLANTSELLHFMKQDRDIGACSVAAQNHLADVIRLAFSLLTTCLQSELAHTMPAFLSPDSG